MSKLICKKCYINKVVVVIIIIFLNIVDNSDFILFPQFECCGGFGFQDWENNVYFNCNSPGVNACGVPYSCCISTKVGISRRVTADRASATRLKFWWLKPGSYSLRMKY